MTKSIAKSRQVDPQLVADMLNELAALRIKAELAGHEEIKLIIDSAYDICFVTYNSCRRWLSQNSLKYDLTHGKAE